MASVQKKVKELDQYKNKALEEEDIDKVLSIYNGFVN